MVVVDAIFSERKKDMDCLRKWECKLTLRYLATCQDIMMLSDSVDLRWRIWIEAETLTKNPFILSIFSPTVS